MSYQQFWPAFLECHEHPWTRRLHAVATFLGLLCVYVAFPLTRNVAWLLMGPALSYPIAWFSHAVFEHKRPAAFRHPYWSFLGDLDMVGMMALGTLDAELARLRAHPGAPFSPRRRLVHHATEVAFFLALLAAIVAAVRGSLRFALPW